MKEDLNANLISTLEQSLRLTRATQTCLIGKLEEIKSEINKLFGEAEALNSEINALESSANQTESALSSLLIAVSVRSDEDGL